MQDISNQVNSNQPSKNLSTRHPSFFETQSTAASQPAPDARYKRRIEKRFGLFVHRARNRRRNTLPRYHTHSRRVCHRTIQHDDFRLSNVSRAARVAASKTSSTPSPVNDEHSRYFRALICVAVSLPSFGVTKRSDFFRISSIAPGFSRRSFFSPTRIIGTPGHRSFASSIHCTECGLVCGP